MNIPNTQQNILHLLTQSEAVLQDLLTDHHGINTEIHAANKQYNLQKNHKKTIKYIKILKSQSHKIFNKLEKLVKELKNDNIQIA